MKDTKEARFKRGATMLRNQFAQQRGGAFSQVLNDEEIVSHRDYPCRKLP